ncbi:hypothetical protein [Longispora fulva]|uniref:Uncharacterized protein n=1 Tax=Longispora fulva TaxID=619741 RepID=A0A8J7GEE7_9ACTN|nr:hypothetical protein [Longispora fulva]MBG6136345.1 hypothetical protein [Longispora fulva]
MRRPLLAVQTDSTIAAPASVTAPASPSPAGATAGTPIGITGSYAVSEG